MKNYKNKKNKKQYKNNFNKNLIKNFLLFNIK